MVSTRYAAVDATITPLCRELAQHFRRNSWGTSSTGASVQLFKARRGGDPANRAASQARTCEHGLSLQAATSAIRTTGRVGLQQSRLLTATPSHWLSGSPTRVSHESHSRAHSASVPHSRSWVQSDDFTAVPGASRTGSVSVLVEQSRERDRSPSRPRRHAPSSWPQTTAAHVCDPS